MALSPRDFQLPCTSPALIYCDNQLTIQLVSNKVFHKPKKHLDVDSHLVHEKVDASLIKLLLLSISLQTLHFKLRLHNIYAQGLIRILHHNDI